ncbi:MAG: hypothetical protein IJW53_06420 [Clostridia bacterium]|nr:hypothetical protein [Clostridia bacterium]
MNRILVIANNESDLLSLMRDNGLDITVIPSESATRPVASDYDALCILGGTESSALILSSPLHDLFDGMREAKKPVFCEFVGSFGPTRSRGSESTARQRMVYRSSGICAEGVSDGDLLDGQSNECLKLLPTGDSSRPILSYLEDVCAHTHTDISEDEHKAGKWALWRYDESLLVSSIRLANFHRARFAPSEKWRALIGAIVEFLAGERVELSFPAPIVTHDKNATRECAVQRGIEWIKRSGLLKDGGRLGINEGYSNGISAKNGEHKLRVNVRADCNGEIGGALLFDEMINGNTSSGEIARELFDFNFRWMQVKDGEHRGMMRWCELAWCDCYQDDVARAILPLLLVRHINGDTPYLDEICEALDYLLLATCEDGIRPPCTVKSEKAPDEGVNKAAGSYPPCAHFNAYYHACLLLAYRATGKKEYLDYGVKGLETIMNAYPNTRRETSESEEMARLILPLAVLYGVTKNEEHLEWLSRVADDLESHRHPSGGYREWDTGYTAACSRNHKGECALLAENGDPVADLLYTNNWLPLGFAYAYMVTGEERFLERWESVSDFLATAQMRSDIPHLDGAWARAFDLERRENYGMPHDAGWGPYCIESGWTIGEILMGLMFMNVAKSTRNDNNT